MTENLCIDAMRIVSLSFVFAGANVAFQGIFQALDSGIESLIISVFRQFLFVIPLALVFSNIAIKNAKYTWLIWTSFSIIELATVIIAYFLMKRINRIKLKKLKG